MLIATTHYKASTSWMQDAITLFLKAFLHRVISKISFPQSEMWFCRSISITRRKMNYIGYSSLNFQKDKENEVVT